MKRERLWLGCAAALSLAAGAGGAWGAGTAAPFLKIAPDARSMGLGSGGVALAQGAADMWLNAASIGAGGERELRSGYGRYAQGYDILQLVYGQPTRHANLGVGLVRLSAGGFEGRDERGRKTSDFQAEDRAVSLGLGRRLGGGALAVGGALKHVASRIESESGQAFALDLGVLAFGGEAGLPFTLGAAVKNLGGKMRFLDEAFPLPLAVSAGASVKALASVELVAGVERQVHERSTEFGAGLRVAAGPILSFSASLSRPPGGEAGPLGRLAGGIGLQMSNLRLDYAFAPMGALGNAQRFSLTMRFGRGGPQGRPMEARRREREPAGGYLLTSPGGR